jgi:hypothetical protein
MSCDRKTFIDHITLEDVESTESITLRNPNFGDTHTLQTNLNKNKLNSNIEILFKRDIAPVFESKEYSFEKLNNYIDIKTWFESYYGNEMKLTDMWGQVWIGTITSDMGFQDYDYNRDVSNCNTSLTFTFEGIKQ